MSIVPVHIRPHLIPFFFKEFEGEQATYLNKEVTAIKISTRSSLGKMIRMFMIKAETPVKSEFYQLYLSVADTPSGKAFEGTAYSFESGSKSFLELPPDVNKVINDLLEDIFRITFVFFVQGYMHHGKPNITKAINEFIDMYDLLEVGFCNEKLRQLYYREKRKNKKVSRLQFRIANRVTNYS
ncbi:MAG: hypothetical protein BM557_01230 [Flavobacterium sp. MedPE-SWcel]|uniref:hypothetical protein n=1 Tax=uncultured Flavobacterium sp. TaxID=165435 RepID=UPI0009120157|nr:hypothetical protein [uncultured Flavobacterium sp.]OIQ22030.1 MAG: hypothetical protein BM557_01230 [Flavobacterium sp. MedPE-SWcel]